MTPVHASWGSVACSGGVVQSVSAGFGFRFLWPINDTTSPHSALPAVAAWQKWGGDSIFFFGGPSLSYHPRAWISCPGWPDLGPRDQIYAYCRWRMQHVSMETPRSPTDDVTFAILPSLQLLAPESAFHHAFILAFCGNREPRELGSLGCEMFLGMAKLVLRVVFLPFPWVDLASRTSRPRRSVDEWGLPMQESGMARCVWRGPRVVGVAPSGLASTHRQRIIRTGGGIGQLQEKQKSERGCRECL